MSTLNQTLQALSCFFLLLVIGCHQEPYLEDDEGAPRQASSTHADSLSLPYAQGTKVHITVHGGDGVTTWKLQSTNPAVLSIDKLSPGSDSTPTLVADCTAVGAGDTMLRLSDASGAELRQSSVSVAIPDRLRLLAHGALRLVEQNADALLKTEVHEARILAGSQGVFALIYQKGEQRLYGRGLVLADALTGVTVTTQTTTGAAVSEWLFIKPQATGSYSLTLRRGQAALLTLPVVGVPESEIGSFGLQAQQSAAPQNDQNIWVALQSRDMLNRDIQGVFGSWTLSGAAQAKGGGNVQEPTGDLYRYTFAAGMAQELAVTRGPLRSTMTITAAKGAVYDTSYLGCSLGARSRAGSPLGLLVALAALGLTLGASRRRRIAG